MEWIKPLHNSGWHAGDIIYLSASFINEKLIKTFDSADEALDEALDQALVYEIMEE